MILLSDGAWGGLGLPGLKRVLTKPVEHLSDLPAKLIQEASRYGRPDDMTVLVAGY